MSKFLKHIIVHLGLSSLLLLYLLYSQYGGHIPWHGIWDIGGLAILATIIFTLLSLPLSVWLDKNLSWGKYPGWRLIGGMLIHYILALGVVVLTFMLHSIFKDQYDGIGGTFVTYQEVWIKLFLLLFILFLIAHLIALSVHAFRHYHQQRLQKIEIEQEHIHTQFEILRTQLNPHFLFNCLNTVSALIYRSPEEAERFIRAFAQLNQRILATQKEELVSLQKEIEVAKLYLSLMQIRYENALIINVHIEEELKHYQIPPLSLQILLENAIKHNALTAKNPLLIEIKLDQQQLMIRNNKLPLQQKPPSFAMGLDLLRKRYAFFTDKKLIVNNADDQFTVILPMLEIGH